NMAPKCGDPETVDLVTQIADDEMAKTVGREAANLFTYELTGIRTTGVNEKIGSYECAADLQMKTEARGSASGSITYTVENTDDGDE
ncbi:hypothetical protein JG626_19065, partial [Vibrio cholerae]|uniref:hypothetical protein n=2 Tax=Vibrionaceae TaxID=641 RepID=UPI0018F0AADA